MKGPNETAKTEKLTVFGLFFRLLGKYPALSVGASALNIAAVTLYVLVPWYYKRLFDALSSAEPKEHAASAALAAVTTIALLNAARLIMRRVSEWMVCKLQPLFMQDAMLMAFEHVMKQSYAFFANNFSGSILRKIQRLPQGFMTIHDIMHFTVETMIVSVIGSIWLIGTRNASLAGIFAAWMAAALAFNYLVSKRLRKLRKERVAKDTEATGLLSDALGNAQNVQLFSSRRHEYGLLKKVVAKLSDLRFVSWDKQNHYAYLQVAALMAVEFAAIWLCVLGWKEGTVTVGDIVLAQSILLKLNDSIWNLTSVFRSYYESYADSQEMVDILNTAPEIRDADGAKRLAASRGKVFFDEVDFNYNETRKVLGGFSLSIAPREKVALVGPSGAGKSTIAKLILRFYDVSGGKIEIDGQDISKVTQDSLRDAIAMVPQEPFLFHRTLMDNIRYGRRGASDAEVFEASKKARCHEFISALPEGYETLVGERGVKLSGGERQRVAIARAILKNAPILVLDEATSSLDSESEHLIHEAMRELMRDKTVIVIAHRLSTIMEMDRIVVVEGGRIADSGTHDELLRRGGTYKKLWEIQAGGFLPTDEEDEVGAETPVAV